MIVASDDFPVPDRELEMVGIKARHVGRNPHSVPPDCVGVVTIPKMMSHTMFKMAKKVANKAGVRFGVAKSATGVLRLMEEWGLAVGPEIEVIPASKILGGDAVVRIRPPYQTEPPPPVPLEKIETVSEEPVKKLKWIAPDYTDVAALVAGIPEGPYENFEDMCAEANRWKEIRNAKRHFVGKPWKVHAFQMVCQTARKYGIVFGERGRWMVKRDPKVVLTLFGENPEPTNGHVAPPPSPVKVEPQVDVVPEMISFQIDVPRSLVDTLAACRLEEFMKGAMKAENLKIVRSSGLIADSTWLPAAREKIIDILKFNLGESRIS
jgi:hypothetical protein